MTVVDNLSLWVQIKDTKALNACGVFGGAMLLKRDIQGSYIEVSSIEFDHKVNLYYFRETGIGDMRQMRVPIYCTTFDFEAFKINNAEYFI